MQCDIGKDKWMMGYLRFDGRNRVLVQTKISGPDVWTYYVELYNDRLHCVTRRNGMISRTVPVNWL